MLTVRTTLGTSPVHGIGLFANEPIAEGQPVWRAMRDLDQILPVAKVHSLPAEARAVLQHYAYRSVTLPDQYILEFDNARFMNHSDAPNTDFSHDDVGIATRDIAKGEELTCDYRQFCVPEDLGFLEPAAASPNPG